MASAASIETKEISLLNKYIENVYSELQSCGDFSYRLSHFKNLKSDEERVTYALNLDCVKATIKIPQYEDIYNKSSDLAIKYRNSGNKKFQERDYASALVFYHKSIIIAPVKDEGGNYTNELTLAYANRSAAFFHLHQFEYCLADVKRAFHTKYPQDLQYKLYDRQARCFMELKQFFSAHTAFKNAKNALSLAALDFKKKLIWDKDFSNNIAICSQKENVATEKVETQQKEKDFPNLKNNSNQIFNSLSNTCDINFTETDGRFIVSQESVSPGEVILVEKPFASVLLPEKYSTHCHHCFVNLIAPVACDKCALAVFCSEQCKDQAVASYHRYECEILPVIHRSGMDKFGHLAVRAITVKNADYFQSFKENLSQQVTDPRLKGCNADKKYISDDYSTIYNLVSNTALRSGDDLLRRAITSILLLKCLQKSNYFSERDENLIPFIGGLLLSHLQTFPCNAHEISEFVLDETQVATSICQEIGAGIYATLSLFNHSCDPSVARHFYGDSCVVRAIKPLSKGDPVADNYGAVFAIQERDLRHSILDQYFFECKCEACVNNWPLYVKIKTDNPDLICSSCKADLDVEAKEAITFACTSCHAKNDIVKKKQRIQDCTERYYKGLNSLLDCRFKVAMNDLSKALNGLCCEVKLPYREVNNAQEAIKQCFNSQGNCNIVKERN